MSNWTAITSDLVKAGKGSALLASVQSVAAARGDGDPVPEMIADVTATVRACVSSGNTLDEDSTKIPNSLKGLAIRMITLRLKDYIEMEMSPFEKQQAEADRGYLNRINDDKIRFETPRSAVGIGGDAARERAGGGEGKAAGTDEGEDAGTMSSELEQFQLDCAARLSSESYFEDISVFVVRPRSSAEVVLLQTKLDDALSGRAFTGGKCGVTCTVRMPSAEVPEPNLPGPVFDAAIVVRVTENPVVNMGGSGTGKSAEDVALAVIGALHQSVMENLAVTAAKEALRPQPEELLSGKVVYDCNLLRRFALPAQARVAPVLIVASGALPDVTVTLNCATAGAAIYYSVDGSYPTPASASLYGGGFVVATACKVRAAAFFAGISGSNLTAAEINN